MVLNHQTDKNSYELMLGWLLLAASLPLLAWQAFPQNQITVPPSVFLVAHSIMEIFAVVVAALIFFVVYGTRDTIRSLRTVILGYAFLGVALFDTLHLLAYEGMPALLTANSANKSILFWLAARVSAGLGLLAYVTLSIRPVRHGFNHLLAVIGSLVAVTLISLLFLLAPEHLPAMFVKGAGLTTFKVVTEWLIFGFYLGTAAILWWRRAQIVGCDVSRLLLALLLMAAGELFFTLYVRVTSTANLLGHVYKVVAYYFLYRAIFAEAVRQPFLQIQHMLSHDELTGLASWSAFNERLQQVLDRGRKEDTYGAVILLGLDNFRTVNATLGHDQGDLLLRGVAERIRAAVPESVFVARFSGDNFFLLLEQADVEQARQTGEMLLQAMRAEFDLGHDHITIGASLGMAMFPKDGDSPGALLRHVDVSLQRAKAEGRQRLVRFSQELSESIQRRALLESRLRYALEREEFSLQYQPKVALSDGRIAAWEALLRWHPEELGAVSPVEFIPVAEESGLIIPIGNWVLCQACRQMVTWSEAGLDPAPMAVNLSTRQFRQNDLPEKIAEVLQETGLPARLLNLEITESMIMDNPATAAEMMAKLVRLGILIHIDDFGTGHSSLSYLKTFPINSLKIDRSFINDIPEDDNDVAIVRAVLSLGRSLGFRVVAEGVETEAQLAFLSAEGCDEMQGYLFSRPVTAHECEELMRTGRRLALPMADVSKVRS